MDGQKMFEYLSKLTEEQRKAVIVDNFWNPDAIDDIIDEYPDAFTEDEAKILCSLSPQEKMALVEAGHDEYFNTSRSDPEERDIHSAIIVKMSNWLKEHKTYKYNVTVRFAMFATIPVNAKNAEEATKLAYQHIKDGKVTEEDLKEYDTMWQYCQVTDVYNFDNDVMELQENESRMERRPKAKEAFTYEKKEA